MSKILFEKHCGKFHIKAIQHFNGSKECECVVTYTYNLVTLKELNFPADKKQVAIDVASHIAAAIELYRYCIVARVSDSLSML